MTLHPVSPPADQGERIRHTDVRATVERARAQREAIDRIAAQASRLLRPARVVVALRGEASVATPVGSNGAVPHPGDTLLAIPDGEVIPDQPYWLPEASRNGHAALAARALPPGCSAYAQLPLLLPDGTPFGYLAALDSAQVAWSGDDRERLQVIADLIISLVASEPADAEHDTPGPSQTKQLRRLAATARAITAPWTTSAPAIRAWPI